METIGSALGNIFPILAYLRPDRAPYLFSLIVVSICTVLVGSATNLSILALNLYRVPIYSSVLLLSILVLRFRLPPPAAIHQKGEKESETDSQKIAEEDLALQFKITRSACIAAGVVALYNIVVFDEFIYFIVIPFYIVVVLHIVIFVLYSLLRINIDEGPTQTSIVQIGLVMSVMLLTSVYLMVRSNPSDGSQLFDCYQGFTIDRAESEKNIRKNYAAYEVSSPEDLDMEKIFSDQEDISIYECGATAQGQANGDFVYKSSGEEERKFDQVIVDAYIFLCMSIVFLLFWILRFPQIVALRVMPEPAQGSARAARRRKAATRRSGEKRRPGRMKGD